MKSGIDCTSSSSNSIMKEIKYFSAAATITNEFLYIFWCETLNTQHTNNCYSLLFVMENTKSKMYKNVCTFVCLCSWSTSTLLRKCAECILFCFVLIFLLPFFSFYLANGFARVHSFLCVFTDDCQSTNHSAITRNDDKASLKQQSNKRWQVVKWTFLKMMPKEKYACRLSFETAESSISARFVVAAAGFFLWCSRGQQQSTTEHDEMRAKAIAHCDNARKKAKTIARMWTEGECGDDDEPFWIYWDH